jgi:hypothetical protein
MRTPEPLPEALSAGLIVLGTMLLLLTCLLSPAVLRASAAA